MTRKTDYLKQAAKEKLEPILNENDFQKTGSRSYVRVREDFVDVIGFQLSQYGSKLFYVHYYCNLLTNPLKEDPIGSYAVGERLDYNDNDDIKWIGDTEEAATLAMASVASITENKIIPWFNSILTPKDYICEYVTNPNTDVNSFDIATMLLRLGRVDRPFWILDELLTLEDEKEKSDTEKIEIYTKLIKSIDKNKYPEILDSWREENISKIKYKAPNKSKQKDAQ
jgi:hypothetical protein